MTPPDNSPRRRGDAEAKVRRAGDADRQAERAGADPQAGKAGADQAGRVGSDQAGRVGAGQAGKAGADRQAGRTGAERRSRGAGGRSGRRPRSGPAAGSLLVAAAVTGGWAAVVSFAPVLIVVVLGWFGTTAVPAGTAVRFAVTGWLLAHGVPFTAAHGEVGLVPLGLTALVVWRLWRAGAYTARAVGASTRDVPHVVVTLALVYGVLGCLAALVVSSPGFTVSPLLAFVGTSLLAALAGTAGALVETGYADLVARLPRWLRDGLVGGATASLVILGAGAGLAGVASVIAYQDAVALYREYQVGFAGGAGITLVGLLYAPNLVVWAASYLIGPGFGFGTGTEVTIFHVLLGPLPAVPVLAGLPAGPAPPVVGLVLAVPVLAGVLVGVTMVRRRPDIGWGTALATAATAGPVAGTLLGAACFASSGPLGSGQLAQIGPSWWLVGLVTSLLVGCGAGIAVTGARLVTVRR